MLRVARHYVSGPKLRLFLLEGAAVAAASFLGAVLGPCLVERGAPHNLLASLGPRVWLVAAFALFLQAALYLFDLYDLPIARDDRARGSRALRAAGLAVTLLSAAVALAAPDRVPEGALLGTALGGALGSWAVRGALEGLVGQPTKVLLVGLGPKARVVAEAVASEADGYRICQHWPALGPAGEIAERVEKTGAQVVVAALEEARGASCSEALLECRAAGHRVYDAAGFLERAFRRVPVELVRPSELAYSDDLTRTRVRQVVKRGMDLVAALALATAALPVAIAVFLAVRLDSRGPAFYSQERVGRRGRTFKLWKFRSMREDAESGGAVWAKKDDDRVTRVGRLLRKTRMDELPQVLNVLSGDMSFVGPRPERPSFVADLAARIPLYRVREVVKPGITGWAQIRYPYGASVADARNKLEFDLYYVKNGTLFLDLAIVFHTVRHVLLGRGAR